MFLSAVGPAAAQQTHYSDVAPGVWYEEAAAALLDSGALDRNESRLRPNDLATRAEVMKLLVEVYDADMVNPATPSFSDVPRTSWYYTYVETAAREGWLKGDGECYGTGRASTCTARPAANVNRAEMAIMMQRAFNLQYMDLAPVFSDNQRGTWYFHPIQTAADNCILQGDAGTNRVRPAANMNRAEMVVMFDRASKNDQEYGDDCGENIEPVPNMTSATVRSSQRVRVSFNVDLDVNRIDNVSRYDVDMVGGGNVDIEDITVISARMVDIDLGETLEDDETFRVSVTDMRTQGMQEFDDSVTFVFHADETDPVIQDVTVRDSDTIRVHFTEDVDSGRADEPSRYEVERAAGGGAIDVDSAIIIDARTVDLELDSELASNVMYRVRVEGLLANDDDAVFSDDRTFSSNIPEGDATIESAVSLSATRLRLTFSEDLDEARAEEGIRYRVNGHDGDIGIDSVGLVGSNVVEIVLDESLQGQDLYTITVTNLETVGGQTFTDDITLVYSAANVSFSSMLSGLNEVPPVVTSATGTGSFTLTSTGLQYDITLRNLSGAVITGAHFHRGDVGVSGPVVEPITFNTTTLRATGTWTDLTAEERSLLLDGDIYVNVHTVARPDGEIRGQVIR